MAAGEPIIFVIKLATESLAIAVVALLTAACSLYNPCDPGNFVFNTRFIRWIRILDLLGVQLDVKNRENYDGMKENFVMVLNHQSMLDAIIVTQLAPPRTSCVMKNALFYVPFYGVSSWLFGSTFVPRGNSTKAVEIMKTAAENIHKQNSSVLVFAEGSRYQKDSITKFKKGAFHFAIATQLPILPVVIANYRHIYDYKRRRFGKGVIRVFYLPALPTVGLGTEDVDALADTCHGLMSSKYTQVMVDYKTEYESLSPIEDKLKCI